MDQWQILIEVDRETGAVNIDTGGVPIALFLGVVQMLIKLAAQQTDIAMAPKQSPIVPVKRIKN